MHINYGESTVSQSPPVTNPLNWGLEGIRKEIGRLQGRVDGSTASSAEGSRFEVKSNTSYERQPPSSDKSLYNFKWSSPLDLSEHIRSSGSLPRETGPHASGNPKQADPLGTPTCLPHSGEQVHRHGANWQLKLRLPPLSKVGGGVAHSFRGQPQFKTYEWEKGKSSGNPTS